MTNVMTVGRNILLLFWSAVLASAQARRECSAPPEYQHATLLERFSTRQRFRDGDKVYYQCPKGTTPSGSCGVRCKNGAWTKLKLTCWAVEETTCPHPAVADSVQTGGEVPAYQVGDEVTVTCRQGFQLNGAQKVTCASDGQWQPQPPWCLPLKDGGCRPPQPASGSNARLTDQYIMKTSFASGDVVKYECQVGYVGIGGNRYRSCKNGQWTEQYLKCKPKPCGSAGEIQHGYFTYTGSVFGDTATAVCDDGYRLVGRATRNCLNGGWDGRIPACEAVECEEPPATNADKVDIRDFYTYKAVVRYRCRLGTLVGQQSIWCTKDGTWSSPPPKCQVGETTCPHPAVADSVQSGREVPAYRVGGKVTITCRQGFQLNGAQQVICGSDGQWQPQPPQCLPLPEDRIEQPSINERPSTREQPHINEQPTTTEQPHITEQLSTTKQPPLEDGRCRPPQPTRGSNARLTDQYIMKTSFASGDVVKYECQVGYVGIGGNRYRSCKNGQWTEQYLKCKPKPCGSAGEIQHGYFTYTGSVFGDTATAVCDDGYRLVGRATRNCLNGGWDGRIPTCEAVECNDPPATNAEMLDIRDFYTYKAVVRYRCHGGTLVGQKDIWCTKDGTWSSLPPKCQVMTCPTPPVAHAYWTAPRSNQYQYKEAVSIACNLGFTMIGPNLITCDKDGQWSPKLPICRHTYNHWNRWQ